MKTKVKVIGYGLLVMGMLLWGMPAIAQQQEWRSTSTMQTSGSNYAPQVTAVGASQVAGMATTADASFSDGRVIHRTIEYNDEFDDNDTGSPIGDAVLPLMLMAVAFAAFVALRKRAAAKE